MNYLFQKFVLLFGAYVFYHVGTFGGFFACMLGIGLFLFTLYSDGVRGERTPGYAVYGNVVCVVAVVFCIFWWFIHGMIGQRADYWTALTVAYASVTFLSLVLWMTGAFTMKVCQNTQTVQQMNATGERPVDLLPEFMVGRPRQ